MLDARIILQTAQTSAAEHFFLHNWNRAALYQKCNPNTHVQLPEKRAVHSCWEISYIKEGNKLGEGSRDYSQQQHPFTNPLNLLPQKASCAE